MTYINLIEEIENLENASFEEKIDWFKRCHNNTDNDEVRKEIEHAVSRMAEQIKENALKRIKENSNDKRTKKAI